ncbi:hypothetical protein Pmani_013021 [Petrolisthes manimaculis]|uniref:Uncharacterized protein n=1 Tax=Petrolisthes manimaculis TaxID=1843537 RepID=A0AAE1U9R6_9EUCA|nr:hypothetical protein Pmani_013021 [Petrolisthes manimaculis]
MDEDLFTQINLQLWLPGQTDNERTIVPTKPDSDSAKYYCEFTHITRTLHISDALNVCKNQKLEPRFIYSPSSLKRSTLPKNNPCRNLRVLWFRTMRVGHNVNTPSRYGNVQFAVNANTLLEHWKYYYFVDIRSTPKYSASRILVTNNDYSRYLRQYDPYQYDGPWKKTDSGYMELIKCLRYNERENSHKHTVEFMIEPEESDMKRLFKECTLSFTNHHSIKSPGSDYAIRCLRAGACPSSMGRKKACGTFMTKLKQLRNNGNHIPFLKIDFP